MEKIVQKQNIQISRLFALKDPLVDVIYVAPFDLPYEITNYYTKVSPLFSLKFQGPRTWRIRERRLQIYNNMAGTEFFLKMTSIGNSLTVPKSFLDKQGSSILSSCTQENQAKMQGEGQLHSPWNPFK